jgi:hypothetical protein
LGEILPLEFGVGEFRPDDVFIVFSLLLGGGDVERFGEFGRRGLVGAIAKSLSSFRLFFSNRDPVLVWFALDKNIVVVVVVDDDAVAACLASRKRDGRASRRKWIIYC